MQTGRWHRGTGLTCDVWLFCLVWYRGCRRRFESLADQHQWERTQTISGKGVTLHLCQHRLLSFLFSFSVRLFLVSSCFLAVIVIFVYSSSAPLLLSLLLTVSFVLSFGRRCSATTRRLTTLSSWARPPSLLQQVSLQTTGTREGWGDLKGENVSKRVDAKMLFTSAPALLCQMEIMTHSFIEMLKSRLILLFLTSQERLSVGHSGDSRKQPRSR